MRSDSSRPASTRPTNRARLVRGVAAAAGMLGAINCATDREPRSEKPPETVDTAAVTVPAPDTTPPPPVRSARRTRAAVAPLVVTSDSASRAALRDDSIYQVYLLEMRVRYEVRRDSIARVAFVRDSIAREAFVRDSIAREAFVRDSIAHAAFVHDSIAHAAFVHDSIDHEAAAARDALARKARADSAFGVNGAMPRIEGDPNIVKPQVSVSLTIVDQVWDSYQQLQLAYGRPIGARKTWSWEVDLPVQRWDSVSGTKTVFSFANITLIANHRISGDSATWRQTLSLLLSPQSGLVDPSVGNDQWLIQPQYTASRWFLDDQLQFRGILSWTYGWWVMEGNGTRQKNVIIPRLVLTGRVTPRIDGTLDLRPRIDITRHAFYSTLMVQASGALSARYGLQAGYEFPLDSMARQRVENWRIYLNLSRLF